MSGQEGKNRNFDSNPVFEKMELYFFF